MSFDRAVWTKAYSARERRARGYHCYCEMLARCFNPKNNRYDKYGAMGITVCERWCGAHGWENFLADMGSCPSTKHSIDRHPDPKGNYEPSNCRWATASEQWYSRQRTQHGKLKMYQYGCRCEMCRRAKREEHQQQKFKGKETT